MRVTVDAIKITLFVYRAFARMRDLLATHSLRGVRVYIYIYVSIFTYHARITSVLFVRTEVDRLNCEFRDNYASRGNRWRATRANKFRLRGR